MLSDPALRALLLSFAAGLSTLIGAVVVLFLKGKSQKLLAVSLGFAGGVMISVSLTDLFPNAEELLIEYTGGKLPGVLLTVAFLLFGVLIAAGLDRFVPHQEFDEASGEKPHYDLFRVGFVSMLAIGLHNFPEGIATFMAGYEDASLGITIALAIAFHNIPEGISVAMPIYFASGSKLKAFKYTFLSGFAEPVGALLAYLILRPFINSLVLGSIFALIAGIMVYIAIEELIPSSRQYGFDRQALAAVFIGLCLMPVTHVF